MLNIAQRLINSWYSWSPFTARRPHLTWTRDRKPFAMARDALKHLVAVFNGSWQDRSRYPFAHRGGNAYNTGKLRQISLGAA